MQSVHFNLHEAPREMIEQASESVLIVSPHIDEQMLEPLFALSEPIEVQLLTRRETVAANGNELRQHVKQLQDINLNVEVRATEESFPAFTIVDGEHLHCHSAASKRLASSEPEGLVDAAEGLWARSEPVKSLHQDEDIDEVPAS